MRKGVMAIIVAVLLVIAAGSWFVLQKAQDKTTTIDTSSGSNTKTTKTETPASNSSQSSSKPSSNTTQSSETMITIKDFAFSPASTTIKKGTTVMWMNEDAAVHTATSDSGSPESFDSGNLAKGKSFSHTFNTVGTYKYHCTPHPSMTATITVTE